MTQIGEVIVKVGNGSDIVLRNVKAYRALDLNDVNRILNRRSGIRAIIIDDDSLDKDKLPIEKWKSLGIEVIFKGCAAVKGVKAVADLRELQDELSRLLDKNVKTVGLVKKSIEKIGEVQLDENVKAELMSLKAELAEARRVISTLRAEKQSLIEQKAELEGEKERLNDELNQTLDRIKVMLDLKKVVEDERDNYKTELEACKSELEVCKAQLETLKPYEGLAELYEADELKSITAQLDSLKQRISELEQEITEKNNEIEKLQSETEELTRHKAKISSLLERAVDRYCELEGAVIEKDGKISELEAYIEKLEDSLNSVRGEFQQLKDKYDEEVKSYEEELKSKDVEIIVLTNKLDDSTKKCEELQVQVDRLESDLKKKELELAEAIAQYAGSDVNKLTETIRILEEAQRNSIKNIEYLTSEVESLREKLKIAKSANKLLEENNKRLKSSIIAVTRGAIGIGKIQLVCDYSAKAQVIPVFGSGSYGITTLAVSIAHKLKGRVLFMDFDLVNPKADSWFCKSPIIKELPNIRNPMRRTGVGALLEKGSEYVFDNEKAIFQRAVELRDVTIDYFSGLYDELDITQLASVDFTQFMNYVGNSYDYVVVDLGRLGSSDAVNAIIKMFDSIAYKSVVVTLKDKFDVRTFAVKANNEKLRTKEFVWVLNFAEDTKLDDIIVRSTNGAKLVIMPKEMRMYGSGKGFDKFGILKDRLHEIVVSCVGEV